MKTLILRVPQRPSRVFVRIGAAFWQSIAMLKPFNEQSAPVEEVISSEEELKAAAREILSESLNEQDK